MAETQSMPHVGDAERTPFATYLLMVYVFMLYSRVFESSMLFGFPNLYVMLVLSVIGLLTVLLKGEVHRALRTPAAMLLLAFTLWAIFVVPFSTWKSESLQQIIVWSKSLASFFIIFGLARTFTDLKKAFSALGFGAAASAAVILLTDRATGGRATSIGTFGNANEIAFHVWFGLPFLVLLIFRSKLVWKLLLTPWVFVLLGIASRTASRAGLVMAAAVVVVSLLKVSFANKVRILAVAIVILIVGALTVSKVALERYKTLFASEDNSAEALSAVESAESRKHLAREAIDLTISHPLFGVGMGAFPSAAAALSVSRGEHPLWLEPHNSYLQVSSEMGVIGVFLYIMTLVVPLRALLRLDRAARQQQLKLLAAFSLCMLLSFTVLVIHFSFDALAYDFYMPMLVGLCTSLLYTARTMLRDGSVAEEMTKEAVDDDSDRAVPAFAGLNSLESPAPSSAPTEKWKQARSRNPYRLGRRR